MDVVLVSLIIERARRATLAEHSAAELLVGIAAGRPFELANLATAWAVAAHVMSLNGKRLDVAPEDAHRLMRDVVRGDIDESTVSKELARWARARPGFARQALTFLAATRATPAMIEWSCPVCGRPVAEPPGRTSVFLVEPSPRDVVFDCARRYRAHQADGRQLSAAVTDPFDDQLAAWRAERVIAASVLQRA